MNRAVTVSLTDDEIAVWLGDTRMDSGDHLTGVDVMRIYDCGCTAKKKAGDAKWSVRYSSDCGVPHGP
jgi:hypothetical protein